VTLAFVDLETTGLDPQLHEPWEIAVIVRGHADPSADGEWCWQVRPDLTAADPGALKVGRYWERLHSGLHRYGPGAGRAVVTAGDSDPIGLITDAEEIAATLAGLLAGAELIGVNVQFDAAFLDVFLRLHNQAPSWDYHLTEMCSMARGWLHGRGQGDQVEGVRRSDDLSITCGVDPPTGADRHSALGDARWVERWYWHLTAPTGLAARLAADHTTVLAELAEAQHTIDTQEATP
jgi:DNA polymerase III epsilon subunit-like protein